MTFNVGVNEGAIRAILIYIRPLTSPKPYVTLALITGAFLVNSLLLLIQQVGCFTAWTALRSSDYKVTEYPIASRNRKSEGYLLTTPKIVFPLEKRREDDNS